MIAKLRILILDDEKIVCERLRPAMEKLGFFVEAVTDSRTALARLTEQRFDVLVTDLKMPGPGGLDVLRFAKEHHPNLKVIVITGFATVEMAREAMKGGALDFIPKPFKMSQLRDLILKVAQEAEQRGRGRDEGDGH